MCGIIGFIPKNNKSTSTGKAIIEQYQRQLSRGQRGFGLMSIFPNKVVIDRATEPTKIILDTYMSQAPIKFFHHRMPTSTDNEMEQTHPFLISHDELTHDYYMIHNGVIRNADALMKIHTEELGYVYKTLHETSYSAHYTTKKFNDSEALAIEVARYFDGKSNEIGALGTIAFIAIRMTKKTHKPVDIIWSRNGGNPIEMVETPEGLLIASEVYHDDAELVPENTFEVIDLNKYFASKKKHSKIIKLIAAGEATYATPPPPKPYVAPTTASMGFGVAHAASIPAKTATSATTTNVPKDDERDIDPLSPREKAFNKMAGRVIDDMGDRIYQFFDDLSYGDVSEHEMVEIANELMETLIEKADLAKDRVRPFFDRLEERNDEGPTPEDTRDFDEIAEAEEEAELDVSSYNESFGISERADRSRARFDEIMY